MAGGMGQQEDLVAEVPVIRHEDARPVEEEAAVQAPRLRELPGLELLQQPLAIRRRGCSAPDGVEEVKRRPGHSHRCPEGVRRRYRRHRLTVAA